MLVRHWRCRRDDVVRYICGIPFTLRCPLPDCGANFVVLLMCGADLSWSVPPGVNMPLVIFGAQLWPGLCQPLTTSEPLVNAAGTALGSMGTIARSEPQSRFQSLAR